MQVFINGRFASQSVTGVQRYAHELLRALDGELERTGTATHTLHLLAPPSAIRLPVYRHITVRTVGRLKGHAWEQLELPWHARSGLLLNFANTGPLLKRRQVVTIHDASVFAWPDAYSTAFRTWYRFLLPALGRVALRVVTDSLFSKSELVRYARIPEDKIRVVPLSGEHIRHIEADPTALTRSGLDAGTYVLAVSSHSPHKNFKVVAGALEVLRDRGFTFVIAGAPNPKIFGRAGAGLPPNAVMAGYVSDGELRALYEDAGCFVYPSLYEGFGLPPLEAMSCGCPVVASRAASLPEVCGDAVLYCDPEDPSDVARRISDVMDDASLRRKLRDRGLARSREFTWRTAAQKILGLVEEVGE